MAAGTMSTRPLGTTPQPSPLLPCQLRRRSDLLLLIIGISACVLSLMHISWHSLHVSKAGPASRHVGGHVKSRLEGFVAQPKRPSPSLNVGAKSNSEGEDGKLWKQSNITDGQQRPTLENGIDLKDDGKTASGVRSLPTRATTNPRTNSTEPTSNPELNFQTAYDNDVHPVANLNCSDHGGPQNQTILQEMTFWSDIPSDSGYLSPMHPMYRHPPTNTNATPATLATPSPAQEQFLTFEPDHGGWNNIRMAMETALVLSHAMGRTLVLPPEQRMYLLDKSGRGERQKTVFGFQDFFHLDAISLEHRGFKVISMEEFLERQGRMGLLRDGKTKDVQFPPENRTNWNRSENDGKQVNVQPLFQYLRRVGQTPEHWDPWKCILAIPSSKDPQSITELNSTLEQIFNGSYTKPKPTVEEFTNNPTPVNASLIERMREMLADRDKLCIYDTALQESKLVHLKVEGEVRLLTHFYAFIFFADWRQDLWSKRFVRDHLRYVDEIVCAAARVVEAVRNHAREYDSRNAEGLYDAAHIRRGDFQFPPTQLPAEQLYDLSKEELTQGSTLYIATDERNKSFFKPFQENYDVLFLDDFLHVIPDVNTNYYGMIDQLVAYKSRVFYGTWWSTLSGYVNRMRGYYISKHKLKGHLDGTMESYYFTPAERKLQMRTYIPVRFPLYMREFPISFRDIDRGIEEIAAITQFR